MTAKLLLVPTAVALLWMPATARPLPEAETAEPRRLAPDLIPPRIRKKMEPRYTEAAREAKLEGAVLLDAVVSADGEMTALRVRRGLGLGLDDMALEAAWAWEFEPARQRRDNAPVAVRVTFEIHFRLL